MRTRAAMSPYPQMPRETLSPEHEHWEPASRELAELNRKLDREHEFRERRATAIWKKKINGLIVPASGVLTGDIAMKPEPECMLGIRWLTVSGFTSGNVTISADNLCPPIVQTSTPGTFTFGKGDIILETGEGLWVTVTGITGSVQLWGKNDELENWYLPWYLG